MTKRHWYNNGIIEKVFYEDDVPDNFILGKLPRSAEHCKNISKAKLGSIVSEETRAKISKALTGAKPAIETRKKLSNTLGDGRLKGFKWYNNGIINIKVRSCEVCPDGFIPGKLSLSSEQKYKISKALQGISRSEQTKEKNRQAHLGKKYSVSALAKRIATKRKNGTLNSSSDELQFEQALVKIFGQSGYIAQYSDLRYPYKCDFYIPSFDLFIELNHHWTHGNHLFNKDSSLDLEKLANWQCKSQHSKFYKQAIYVWTELDPKKLNCAKEHNLNYLVSYNRLDMLQLIERLKNMEK